MSCQNQHNNSVKISEEIYHKLVDQSMDGIFYGQGDHLLYANSQLLKIVGYTWKELQDLHIEDLIAPESQFLMQAWHALRSTDADISQKFEFKINRKDGCTCDVELDLRCFMSEGQPCFLGSVRDITERKAVNRELKESELLFRSFLDFAPYAVLVINKEGMITLINKQVDQLFGYGLEHLLGQSLETMLPVRYRERHKAHFAAYCANPSVRVMGMGLDLYALHKDGHEVPVDVCLSPVYVKDELHVLAAIIDVTERKKNEQLAHQAERTEVLMRIANGAAHEISQPLTVIMGMAQCLKQACGDFPETMRSNLEMIEAAAHRVEEIIKQMKDVQQYVTKAYANTSQIVDFSACASPEKSVPP